MGTPADKENYSLLLRDIRQELDALGEKNGRTYGLTAALPCGTSNMNNMEIETISEYLTEFNLMTYGMFLMFDESVVSSIPLLRQSSHSFT
jgi:chitinase